jgi:hypothetical protein
MADKLFTEAAIRAAQALCDGPEQLDWIEITEMIDKEVRVAIVEERLACAKIAKEYGVSCSSPEAAQACGYIADMIGARAGDCGKSTSGTA